VHRLSLVSFPVYFQCKRCKGTVTAGAVRDFRGAMAGRGEKGPFDYDRVLESVRQLPEPQCQACTVTAQT
jgi:hypothetical protein